jgi:hypothetical protein
MAKLPPSHEMRDLVDELLVEPWDTRDSSPSSSDSLSPMAPLADMSSELEDFSREGADNLFQGTLINVELCEGIKEAAELEKEEYYGIIKNKYSQSIVFNVSSETEENKRKIPQEENSENVLMVTDLEENKYRWIIKNNEMTGAPYDVEDKLQSNPDRAVAILKAEEGDFQTSTAVRVLDQDVVITGVDAEDCEGETGAQGGNKEWTGTFSGEQGKASEGTGEIVNLENEEFLSEVATERSLCAVTEEGKEDNEADTEYPASVSNMRGPHRRTMAAEDAGAGSQRVGTHGFLHMQPETEQAVGGLRRAPDRDHSVSVSGMYHSAARICVSVEQAITTNDIDEVHKGTELEGRDENVSAGNSERSSSVNQVYTTTPAGVVALETNMSNEYEAASGVNTDAALKVGLDLSGSQPVTNAGELRVEIHIVVGDTATSPVKEFSEAEAVTVRAPRKEIRETSVRGALDVTDNLSQTEAIYFGDEVLRAGRDILTETCSAEKCVQTDDVSIPYTGSVDDKGVLRTMQSVSANKFVQTDHVCAPPYTEHDILDTEESSVSVRDLNIIGALTLQEDSDKTSVLSDLSFERTNDTTKQNQSVSANEYCNCKEETNGDNRSFVSAGSERTKISAGDSNHFSLVVGSLVSVDDSTIKQLHADSVSVKEAGVTEQFSGSSLNHFEAISVGSTFVSGANGKFATASVGEEGRLVREGLACTLQVLTYRDQLFPPLCPSCLLPQSAASVRPDSTRVHNSVQLKSDAVGDHVTFLGGNEAPLLCHHNYGLKPECTVARLPSVKDHEYDNLSTYQHTGGVQGPVNVPIQDDPHGVKYDKVSSSRCQPRAQDSDVPGDITSHLYAAYDRAKSSDVTRKESPDGSSIKSPDPTSSGDNVRVPNEYRQSHEMGNLYSTVESEDGENCRCLNHSVDDEVTDPDGENVKLNITSSNGITITHEMNVELENAGLSFTSDCATTNTDLTDTQVKNVERGSNSDGAMSNTEAMDYGRVNVLLSKRNDDADTDTTEGELKQSELILGNDDATDMTVETLCKDQNIVALSENRDKEISTDNRNVGLSPTRGCATTHVVPITLEQLIGATHSNNKSNTRFPFIDDNEDDAVHETNAVAMTTRDSIRLDIDRCEAGFKPDRVPREVGASRGRRMRYETICVESEDMGRAGSVNVRSCDKETQTAQTAVDVLTVAVRKPVHRETQTKAAANERADDVDEAKSKRRGGRVEGEGYLIEAIEVEAVTEGGGNTEVTKSTKQTECIEGGLDKGTEKATKTEEGNEDEVKVATAKNHLCTAPSMTASPVSTANEQYTSSGDTGSVAARDGINCAAAGSSEQDAPESGRAAANSSLVPRDQAPVQRASDAAVPRDAASLVGNRCGDAMRQKNKTNDNDATPVDVKSVIIANGGTNTETASGAANDCNGHVNNHHHHHSTARSILKSVLKRTGSGGHHKKTPGGKAAPLPAPPRPPQQQPSPPQNQPAPKKKHRVQFDESKNKFFDADYVILVREEGEEGEEEDEEREEVEEEVDDEEEEEVCTCGASVEMGRMRVPIVGAVRTPPPAGCRRPMQPPGGAVQVLLKTPGTFRH